MKAITLTQPWATLVAIGAKRFETRSWQTPYRGPLAIHAGKGLGDLSKVDFVRLCNREPFASALGYALWPGLWQPGDYVDPSILPRGAVIAVCDLTLCLATPPESLRSFRYDYGGLEFPPPEPERSFGDYGPGRFAWRLENVRMLPEPIPAKGALGLWEWDNAGVRV